MECNQRISGAAAGFPALDCQQASGYNLFMIMRKPTAAEMEKICRDADCMSVVESIRTAVPGECTITGYNYQLYADVLTPIQTTCAKLPATTAPPTLTPSPASPSNSWPWPTSTPSTTTSFRPTTATPTPQYTSQFDYTSNTSDSHTDPFTTVGIVMGCAFGLAVLVAIVRCCRQHDRRDPMVQANQHLSYGNVGAFDTIATPTRTNTKSSARSCHGDARGSVSLQMTGGVVYKSPDPSAPTAMSTGITVATTVETPAPDLVPLLEDEQITAVRIPLDKITRGERISSGGYGEVFHGTYKGDAVAVKTLLPQHRNDVRRIKSFLKEVKLTASLEHERVVTFVGVAWGSLSDMCVLTEYMNGGDLRSVLARLEAQRKPVGFDHTKVKIALHTIHALTYMHSLQPVVLHRDLKSSNILLDQNMDAKITDFGISRERVESTMTRGVGTSLWMAPEVMMGGRYDAKADIFSFGIVLSELDTNQLPYATQVDLNSPRTNYVELMQDVATGRLTVEFSYASHPDIVALGRDCVAINPAERPTAAEALHRVHKVWQQYK